MSEAFLYGLLLLNAAARGQEDVAVRADKRADGLWGTLLNGGQRAPAWLNKHIAIITEEAADRLSRDDGREESSDNERGGEAHREKARCGRANKCEDTKRRQRSDAHTSLYRRADTPSVMRNMPCGQVIHVVAGSSS
ncbi:hypothetical protein BKA62DRAFT_699759 [Auriculariales sp. MPI-PUGE-AT-0066]|nr:hypothetical protein BKA62DRAFT_699759 [Auriculariales sp. MPI-PUGE-AT-0066]